MAKRTCNCLNIILNITDDDFEEVNGKELLGLEENECFLKEDGVDDPFFRGNLILVKLAFAGIEVVSTQGI